MSRVAQPYVQLANIVRSLPAQSNADSRNMAIRKAGAPDVVPLQS
jgi:hypothetical protein